MEHVVIRSGRAELAVSMAGEGRPVVFLHAGIADRRMWWAQLEAFCNDQLVVAYDRRGFGDTRYKAEPFSNVRDLDAVLEALDIEHAVLVGSSQGGRIAMEYALTHPDRVEGLVLAATAIGGAPEPVYPEKIARLVDEMELAEKGQDKEWLNRLYAHAWLDGPAQQAGRVGGNLRLLLLDMSAIALRADSPGRETTKIDSHARFRDLKMPIELVSGEFDFPHINARSLKLSGQTRRAHLTVVPGTGHFPNLEQPAKFNAILKRALKRMQG
jgi:pimeloyl-ACP methyl ester carboxylesterase